MLPPEQWGKWRQVLGEAEYGLWAATRTIDGLRSGPTAATQLVLVNMGPVALHIRDIEVNWLIRGTFYWYRPGVVEARGSWTLLDDRSFDVLMAMTRREGRRGFGMQGVIHKVVVHLDEPTPLELAFEVSWGFMTPSADMGFFLPALEDAKDRR